MPINGKPLMEYWLGLFELIGISEVLVNTHFHSDSVTCFLNREHYKSWVSITHEKHLLGTAGTIRNNFNFFSKTEPLLVVHADNWVVCNFNEFIDYHLKHRPFNTIATVMTFNSSLPSTCGIVNLDSNRVITGFWEKSVNPPGNIANGAVYIFEPEIISWIKDRDEVVDISNHVLPQHLGRIASWHNDGIHRDIGTIGNLIQAQTDPIDFYEGCSFPNDKWGKWFHGGFINAQVQELMKQQT
jgi:mannose-1-phosphate guanylyltransferase